MKARTIVARRLWALALATCVLACGAPAEAPTVDPTSTSSVAIIGGTPDTGDMEVVAFAMNWQTSATGGKASHCTAEFVSPNTVITAAHCLYPNDTPATPTPSDAIFALTFGNNSINGPANMTMIVPAANVHPDPKFTGGQEGDIAVIVLDQPIQGINPLPVNAMPIDPGYAGADVMLIGYGLTATNAAPDGIKRSVMSKLDGFAGEDAGLDGDVLLVGAQNATPCDRDSGSPALMMFNGLPTLVGVLSGNTGEACETSQGAYVPVNEYISFINQYGTISKINSAPPLRKNASGPGSSGSESRPLPDGYSKSACAVTMNGAASAMEFSVFGIGLIGVLTFWRRKRSPR